MIRYIELALNPNSQTTQRSNTLRSYEKVAEYIKSTYPEAKKILDFGAGLGMGTETLRSITGKEVMSYEPFPKGYTPDFKKASQIKDKFDVVVCLNVLNVLPPNIRQVTVKHLYRVTEKGGIILIVTRGWAGDVNQAKDAEPAPDEAKALIIKGTGAYQKGFDGNELVDYVNSVIPGSVTRMGTKFGKNCIIVKK
jgi:SAM-dependent methyltransferase